MKFFFVSFLSVENQWFVSGLSTFLIRMLCEHNSESNSACLCTIALFIWFASQVYLKQWNNEMSLMIIYRKSWNRKCKESQSLQQQSTQVRSCLSAQIPKVERSSVRNCGFYVTSGIVQWNAWELSTGEWIRMSSSGPPTEKSVRNSSAGSRTRRRNCCNQNRAIHYRRKRKDCKSSR